MNTHQRTRAPRAIEAILGARRARRRTQFVAVVARQLQEIAPGTLRVLVTPVNHNGATRTMVALEGANGGVSAGRAQHAEAFGLLHRAFPQADWTNARVYDSRTGVLSVHEPIAPAALGLDTAEDAQ
ncbi:hypothetical protein [Streptomyces sp. NBC_00199]|uniref:hypothetical protein n=1 Tax=Streptomyces sp. NBC_00199 TaxID=2975678 RepID=UPI002254467E|nr:hypothetical protein [Streptomyces sp. NBC_00199]MCX5266054.1 hypothetical protein [Streptomyces sp. NBC_00199]